MQLTIQTTIPITIQINHPAHHTNHHPDHHPNHHPNHPPIQPSQSTLPINVSSPLGESLNDAQDHRRRLPNAHGLLSTKDPHHAVYVNSMGFQLERTFFASRNLIDVSLLQNSSPPRLLQMSAAYVNNGVVADDRFGIASYCKSCKSCLCTA